MFLSANRNKRSLAVDLKSEAGRAVCHKLVLSADVVLESFGPGVAERLIEAKVISAPASSVSPP